MFRPKIKAVFPCACVPSFRRSISDDDGNIVDVDIKVNQVLPDSSNFDLKLLLKSGVAVDKVDTRLFAPTSLILTEEKKNEPISKEDVPPASSNPPSSPSEKVGNQA